MSEYTVFEDRPSLSDAPDECQYGECDDRPRYYVKFVSPREYVCYCDEHSDWAYNQDYARVRHLLS